MTFIATVLSVVSAAMPSPDVGTFDSSTPVRVRHHHHRKRKPRAPMQTALASYYTLHGGGACGVGDVQNGYRFASLILRCGTRVQFCYRRCVTAIMSDHGPYVGGRTFDLNVNLKYGLNCPDLCSVRWRIAAG
jgi:hypothetical protein